MCHVNSNFNPIIFLAGQDLRLYFGEVGAGGGAGVVGVDGDRK